MMHSPLFGSVVAPNLASRLFRERAAGWLALALRRLVGRHIISLVFVCLRFLIFLIAFLSLRHGDPPNCDQLQPVELE
jgi:hypothetical protein